MLSRPLVPVLLLALVCPILGLTGCGGNAGSTAAATPTPAPAQPANAPTVTLTANPTTVTAGQFTNLQWSSSNATSITITPALPGSATQPLPLSGNATVSPTATTTYTATASSAGGLKQTVSVTVTVAPAGTPALSLSCTAAPASILAGQSSTLTCTSQNVSSVTIDNGVGAVSVPTGTATVKPTATTTYTATGMASNGTTITASVTVTVAAAAQLAVTLSASPNLIAPGQPSTLTWQSQGAAAVTIQPVISGCAAAPCPVALSGSATVSPTQTTTYTVTAKDAAGNMAAALATVSLLVTNAALQNNIKHIIILLQENHSFDNYFGQLGAYKASKGLANDIDGLPANAVQFDSIKTAVHSYHLQTECIEPISPSWNPSWGAFDLTGYTLQPGPGVGGNILVGGTPGMDGFVNDKDLPTTIDPEYHRVMGYYDQTDIPYYYEAATQFATSDRWFSPVLAGTIPNRMYAFTGTSFGHAHDDQPPLGGWTQTMIFDVLNQHGVSWRYYLQDPANFLGEFSEWGDQILINSHVFHIDDWFTTLASATADTDLPSVVFIEHAGNTFLDEHPGNNIQAGAAQVAKIVNALLASPAWRSSVFILSYDEFGGWFDHVPPLSAPAPDNIVPIETPGVEKLLPGDFVHSGFRLPLIVFSPWVKPHFVSHVPRDFTSILKLVEVRFGLPSLTGRDAAADDMTEFFDFSAPFWLVPPPLPAQPTSGVCDVAQELTGQQ